MMLRRRLRRRSCRSLLRGFMRVMGAGSTCASVTSKRETRERSELISLANSTGTLAQPVVTRVHIRLKTTWAALLKQTRRSKHADQNTPINSSRSKLANQNTPIKTRCPCSRRLISVGSEVCLCGQNALPLFTPTFMVWVIGVCLWTLSKRAALIHTDSFVPAFSRACSRRDVRSPSFDHTAALLVRTCVCSFRSRASRSHSLSSTASSGTTLYPRFLPTGART